MEIEKATVQTRNTAQRKLVLEMVRSFKGHPSADDVYACARKRDSRISRGTVYRNLNILSEQGQIRQMSMPAGPIRYDAVTSAHYHFCCRYCSKTIDAEVPYQQSFNEISAGPKGYITESHRLVLVGCCPACATKSHCK